MATATLVRNPELTRSRLLKAATRLFAQRGYSGVSTQEIVTAAKVNKRMLYHYFGDKEGLYREVLRAEWQLLAALLEREIPEKIEGGEGVRESIELFFDFLAQRHEFVRLLLWEGLEGGKISISLWDALRGPVFRKIEALVRAAQASGDLNPALEPGHLIISMMGAISFYFGNAPSLADVVGKDPLGASALKRRKQEVLRLLFAERTAKAL